MVTHQLSALGDLLLDMEIGGVSLFLVIFLAFTVVDLERTLTNFGDNVTKSLV